MFHYGFLLVFPSPCVSSKYSCLFPRTIRNRPPTDGNVKLDPNYPRFFFVEEIFVPIAFSFAFFPSRGRPRVSRSSPSFAAPPNPITRSLLSRAQRNFRLIALIHFRYSFLRLFPFASPKKDPPTCHVSPFLVRSLRGCRSSFCQLVLSRISSFRDPGVKNGRVDLAVAKSVGNMVTMRGKKDPCVCVCVGSKNVPPSN